MRSLYWKIFTSFWLTTILIIFSTAWVTRYITQKASQPAHEHAFMDSYANAAVATFESGKKDALIQWLNQIGLSRHMSLFLLSSTGKIIGTEKPPTNVLKASNYLIHNQLPHSGIFKSGTLILSHEIISTSGVFYRLAAVSEKPLSFFVEIPWASLMLRLFLATLFSGLICYFLSLYLTKPLRTLGMAAKSIATGKLNTRVGHFRGHNKDEIAKLSHEFNRMAEQLEQLMQSKERLLQDISHELRSPLARLNIAIELGRNKTSHLADAEFSRMETECNRLNELIGEILEFARLDASTTKLHLNTTNMTELIQQIVQDGNYEFNTHPSRIISETIEFCELQADQRLIHRGLENIVRNALHYSPIDQQVIVNMYSDNQKNLIYIDIKDRGPGVPEEQLKTIFTPFYRVDSSRTKKTGGYGLGLAIAAQAIAMHHGQIIAKNRKGGGLLIRITLPKILAIE